MSRIKAGLRLALRRRVEAFLHTMDFVTWSSARGCVVCLVWSFSGRGTRVERRGSSFDETRNPYAPLRANGSP